MGNYLQTEALLGNATAQRVLFWGTVSAVGFYTFVNWNAKPIDQQNNLGQNYDDFLANPISFAYTRQNDIFSASPKYMNTPDLPQTNSGIELQSSMVKQLNTSLLYNPNVNEKSTGIYIEKAVNGQNPYYNPFNEYR